MFAGCGGIVLKRARPCGLHRDLWLEAGPGMLRGAEAVGQDESHKAMNIASKTDLDAPDTQELGVGGSGEFVTSLDGLADELTITMRNNSRGAGQ